MSVPTGAGNYPPGVTDADPHFGPDPDALPECDYCGAGPGEPCAPSCHTQTDGEPDVYLDDRERYGERPERIDPQTGFVDD